MRVWVLAKTVISMSRPRNEEIRKAVEAAINHLKLANVSLVRDEVERLLRRRVGWDTIYKNLERLRNENKIHKQILAQFARKKAYIYSVE